MRNSRQANNGANKNCVGPCIQCAKRATIRDSLWFYTVDNTTSQIPFAEKKIEPMLFDTESAVAVAQSHSIVAMEQIHRSVEGGCHVTPGFAMSNIR